jgi:hypothetical protein
LQFGDFPVGNHGLTLQQVRELIARVGNDQQKGASAEADAPSDAAL